MSLIRKLVDAIRRKPPVIPTAWGPVTESWRAQAEANIRADAALRAKVLRVIIRECGGDEAAGIKEARRRYPRGGF